MALLSEEGRIPFEFQADLAAEALATIDQRGRLLIEAPTGTGKTLVAHLSIALLAAERQRDLPRVLVVVPSRSLLGQHVDDARWLRSRAGLALHFVHPDLALPLVTATLSSWGVIYATPITLHRRLRALDGAQLLKRIDAVIFDEIDTYLTLEELEDRRDTGPALQMCLEAGLPIIGFTGTHLRDEQRQAWIDRGFRRVEAAVPDEWLPHTRVEFVGVSDPQVTKMDSAIRGSLRDAYAQMLQRLGPVPWSQIRRLARVGDPTALRLLRLCGERLRLFESEGSAALKQRVILEAVLLPGPTLLLSRYRDTAERLQHLLRDHGIPSWRADGSMTRDGIGRATMSFRALDPSETGALVITRELGGRGLDFPTAARVVVVSPRSNYQTVSQELARIRSRLSATKTAEILYYEDTEEVAKAYRLADHLDRERFGAKPLFEIAGAPDPGTYALESFESRTMSYEESVPY